MARLLRILMASACPLKTRAQCYDAKAAQGGSVNWSIARPKQAGRWTLQGPIACMTILVTFAGCSNEVREIQPDELREGGTYLVAALKTERQVQGREGQLTIPANSIAPKSVRPPNFHQEDGLRRLEFVRAEGNSCIGADTVVINFPPPDTEIRYVTFAMPPGSYVGKETLRAGEDWRTQVPTFAIKRGKAAYLGRLTLESNGDVSIQLNAAEARRRVPIELAPTNVGHRKPLPEKLCTP